ncbi:MAG: hypothetical protein Q9217_005159 [Psora testacea]
MEGSNSIDLYFRKAQGDFCLPDTNCQGLSEAELNELLVKCRSITVKLESELNKRQGAIVAGRSDHIEKYKVKIQTDAENLKILRRLGKREVKKVEGAIVVLNAEQGGRDSRVYKEFLEDIIRNCGSGLALLCAASLGKENVVNMNMPARTSILAHVKRNLTSLNSPALDALAAQYKIPTGSLYNESGTTPERAEKWGHEELASNTTKQIPFSLSHAPYQRLPSMNDELLLGGMVQSRQWCMERSEGQLFSSCVTILIPINEYQDASINIVIGRYNGLKLQEFLQMELLNPS